MLANLFAHHHCSSVDVLGEGARIGGPDEMIPLDLMVSGRGEARPRSPCAPPPREDKIDAAFALLLLWTSLTIWNFGSPGSCGMMGKGKFALMVSESVMLDWCVDRFDELLSQFW